MISTINAAMLRWQKRKIAQTKQNMYAVVRDFTRDLKIAIGVSVRKFTTTPTGKRVGVKGPRGGKQIERSRPGEFPRKETGQLQRETQTRVVEKPNAVEGYIIAAAPHAKYLERGLRPFMSKMLKRKLPQIRRTLARQF